MAYLHIHNLYKCTDIFLFRDCYALEKIHGTSAHVAWHDNQLRLHQGGVSASLFEALFDVRTLAERLALIGPTVTVYGEAYGGSCQKMSHVYGKELKFVAFDVKIGDSWLAVPQAEEVVKSLGLEFVDWRITPATIEAVDFERDRPSTQAVRNGMGDSHKREGVVLRPLIEVTKNNGERVIAKHKRDDFAERQHPPRVDDPAKLQVLTQADAIADEWVTPMRLGHVLDKIAGPHDLALIPKVIRAMIEDVLREGKGEITTGTHVERAIGKKCTMLYKQRVKSV